MVAKDYKRNRARREPFGGWTGFALGLVAGLAIGIADANYARARDDLDFIKRYIFPGCCIPSVGALTAALVGESDLRLVHLEDIGPHYATTLAEWRRNFHARLDEVRALGYPDTFVRMWEYYLCYCEAGFPERALGDAHMVMTREA